MDVVFIQKGEELIEEFLFKVKHLRDMSDDDLCTELEHLKEAVLNSGNSYIQAIVKGL